MMRGILLHTVFARAKFLTTAGHPSSVADINRPRYLKEVIISREIPEALKALAVNSLSYSNSNRRLFRSTPRVYCAVHLCIPFRDFQGTSMSCTTLLIII